MSNQPEMSESPAVEETPADQAKGSRNAIYLGVSFAILLILLLVFNA